MHKQWNEKKNLTPKSKQHAKQEVDMLHKGYSTK